MAVKLDLTRLTIAPDHDIANRVADRAHTAFLQYPSYLLRPRLLVAAESALHPHESLYHLVLHTFHAVKACMERLEHLPRGERDPCDLSVSDITRCRELLIVLDVAVPVIAGKRKDGAKFLGMRQAALWSRFEAARSNHEPMN
ncbi:MAG: hypothetical protein PHX87_03720 [Candidatus Peribacteraceae bacterium]|nr:hypothetical protein [Candidatus Peribacteraceae bacterium]MDD5742513.1 hypothetical protein [Candidatus Peribacteraceae bacterium]